MSEQDNYERLRAAMASSGGDKVYDLLLLILERQDTMIDRLGKMEGDLAGHMQREEKAIEQWMESLPKKPNGQPDVEGHANYHAAKIDEARTRAKFYRELWMTLATKGVFGLLTVIGLLILFWWNNGHGHN